MPERLNINQIVRMPQATNFSSFRQHINNIRRMSQDFDSVSDMFAKESISEARRAGDLGGKNAITFGEDGKPVRASAPQVGGAYVEAYQDSSRQLHIGANQVYMRNQVLGVVTEFRDKPTDPDAEKQFNALITSITNNVPDDIKSETLIDLSAIVGQGRRTLKDEAARKAKVGANHESRVDINERLATVYNISRSDAGFFFPADDAFGDDPDKAQISAEALMTFQSAKDAINAHYAAGNIHAEEHAEAMNKLRQYISMGTLKATLGLNQDNLKVGSSLDFYAKLREFENSDELYLGHFKLNKKQREEIAKDLTGEWALRIRQQNAATVAYGNQQDTKYNTALAEVSGISLREQREPTWQDYMNAFTKYGVDPQWSANQQRIAALGLKTRKGEDAHTVTWMMHTFDSQNSWNNPSSKAAGPASPHGYANRYLTNIQVVLSHAKGDTNLVKEILRRYRIQTENNKKEHIKAFNRSLVNEAKVTKNRKTAMAKSHQLNVDAAEIMILNGIQAGIYSLESLKIVQKTALWKTIIQASTIAERENMPFGGIMDLGNHPEKELMNFAKAGWSKDEDGGYTKLGEGAAFGTISHLTQEYYYGGKQESIAYDPVEEYVIKNWSTILEALNKQDRDSFGQNTKQGVDAVRSLLYDGRVPRTSEDHAYLERYYKKITGNSGDGTFHNPTTKETISIFDIAANSTGFDGDPKKVVSEYLYTHRTFPPAVFAVAEANSVFHVENTAKFREWVEALIKTGYADKYITKAQIEESLVVSKLPARLKNMIASGIPIIRDLVSRSRGDVEEDKTVRTNLKEWSKQFQLGFVSSELDKERTRIIAEEVKNFPEIFETWTADNVAYVWDNLFKKSPYQAWALKQSWWGKEYPHTAQSLNIMQRAFGFYRLTLDKDLAIIAAFKHVSTTMASGADDFVVTNVTTKPPESGLFSGDTSEQTLFCLSCLETRTFPEEGSDKSVVRLRTLLENDPISVKAVIARGVLASLKGLSGFTKEHIINHFEGARALVEQNHMRLIPRIAESNTQTARYNVQLWDIEDEKWIILPEEANVTIDAEFVERANTYINNLKSLSSEEEKEIEKITNDATRAATKIYTKDMQAAYEKLNEKNRDLEINRRTLRYTIEDAWKWFVNSGKVAKDFHDNMFTPEGKLFLGKKTKVSEHKFNINHSVNSSHLGGTVQPFIAHRNKESFQLTIELLTELEDFRESKYPDGKYHAIGIGTNLGWLEADEQKFLRSVIQNGKITENEAIVLAQMRMDKIFESFYSDKRFSHIEWENISNARMAALAVTVYQVGMPEFQTWRNTIKALTRTRVDPSINWEKVAKAIETDKEGTGPALWVTQTPSRAKRVLEILRGQ